MVRRFPSKHRNAPVGREKDKDAFFRLGLLLVVGLVLACGFVYAGRQHFAALKYGYETEKLRSQRDQLARRPAATDSATRRSRQSGASGTSREAARACSRCSRRRSIRCARERTTRVRLKR